MYIDDMQKEQYIVIDRAEDIDGAVWYSVKVSAEVSEWMFKTFKKDVDFVFVNQLKGVWVDMPEKTLTLLKLKWTS